MGFMRRRKLTRHSETPAGLPWASCSSFSTIKSATLLLI